MGCMKECGIFVKSLAGSNVQLFTNNQQSVNIIFKFLAKCPVSIDILSDPEVTANIYCKSRNLPNTDTQNNSTDLR